MNILLIAKLSDNNLNCMIEPLLSLPTVDHIYILRDTIGCYKSAKVTYIQPYPFTPKNKLRHLFKIKLGLNICRQKKIDFIIGILIYPHGYIGRLLSIFTGIPYIHITIAGHREFWSLGKLIEKINFLLFKRSRSITVTGNNTLRYLVSKGYNPQNLILLPNVIKMEQYPDLKRERKYDIISLSRVDKNKNVSLLLKAVSKINKIYNIQVLIGGDGPEYNNLVKLSHLLNIEKNVHFIGWVEGNVKVEFYNSAKIFVLCSRGEGFPLSLLEAMSCGCVPICTDVGDISDVIINDINGYILENPENVNELAEKIERLINCPEKIQTLSEKAKEVKNKYSYEYNEEIWENLLLSPVLQKKTHRNIIYLKTKE